MPKKLITLLALVVAGAVAVGLGAGSAAAAFQFRPPAIQIGQNPDDPVYHPGTAPLFFGKGD